MKQGLSYLHAKAPLLIAGMLLALCFTCVGLLANLPGDLIIFLLCLIAVSFIVPVILEYASTKRFYGALVEIEKSNDSYELLQALLAQRQRKPLNAYDPSLLWGEGALRADAALRYPEKQTLDALIAIERDATIRIAEAARDAHEYRDYIETWSHEVKTPLAAAALMASSETSSKSEAIFEELQRVHAYVEQALFYARSYGVNKDYVLASHRVDKLINEALANRKNILIAHNATIEKDIRPKELSIICDAKWIVFALGQIIDNACKYSQDNKVVLNFTAQTSNKGKADECVTLSVKDQGIGIPMHDIQRVFDKGYVGQNGREETQHKATGIGLYLVSKIAERQGFRVELTSHSSREHEQSYTQINLIFPQEKSRS